MRKPEGKKSLNFEAQHVQRCAVQMKCDRNGRSSVKGTEAHLLRLFKSW